jgi:hypothetical protein
MGEILKLLARAGAAPATHIAERRSPKNVLDRLRMDQ